MAWGWLALLLGVSLLPKSASQIYTWPIAGFTFAIWALPLLAFGVSYARSFRGTAHRSAAADPLLLLLLTLLAGAATLAAFFSPLRALSAPHLWPTLSGIALLLWGADQLSRDPANLRPRVGRLLAGAGLLLALGSCIGWIATYGLSPNLRFIRNDYPFGHSNYTAGAMVFVLPWLAHAAWQNTGRALFAWGLGMVLAVFTLLSTSSRGAILALGVVGVGGVIVILLHAAWSRRAKLLGFAVASVIGVALVLSNERLRDLILGGESTAIAAASNDQRFAMLAAGQHLVGLRPFTGWGPGTVPYAFPAVRQYLDTGIDNALQLHNTPMQLVATIGPTAFMVCLLAVIWWAMAAWRILRSGTPTRPTDTTSYAALASLLGYGVFALTDHQLDLPWFTALLATNTALLCPLRDATHRRWLQLPVVAALAVGVLVAAAPTVRDLRARAAYAHALDSPTSAAVMDRLAQATALNPADPYYAQQAASLAFRFRLEAAAPADRAAWTDRARRALKSALATRTATEYSALNLGWLDLEAGNTGDAAAYFELAFAFAPPRQDLLLGWALAEQGNGQHARAVQLLAIGLLHDPTDVALPLWRNDAVQTLPDEAIQWIQQYLPQLTASAIEHHADTADLSARIDRLTTLRAQTLAAPDLPTPPAQLRSRDGYPILAYHPDGPPPVDFQLVQPAPRELVPALLPRDGIYRGLPVPWLVALVNQPPIFASEP